jgi:Family of unknown function (DUF5329)
MRGILPILLLAATLAVPTGALADTDPDQEIQYLLEFVATSGCAFVRNGSAHDPAGAADHLRLKYRRGKRYADSAEHFIDRLATGSSWSGDAYTVDCDGTVEPTGAWLHRALDNYRNASSAAAQ